MLQILIRMANSADPDQTAPEKQSDLGLQFSYAILSEILVHRILGHLLYTEFEFCIIFRTGQKKTLPDRIILLPQMFRQICPSKQCKPEKSDLGLHCLSFYQYFIGIFVGLWYKDTSTYLGDFVSF